eukprot:scaffold52750_cov55-Phaeocystis_antarctica.AAC.4
MAHAHPMMAGARSFHALPPTSCGPACSPWREAAARVRDWANLAAVRLCRCDDAVAVLVDVHHHHVDVDVLRGRDLLAQRAVELGRRRGPRWRRARAPVVLELAHLPLVLRREVAPLLVSVRRECAVDGGDPVLEELALAQQADRPIGRERRGLGLWRWLLARRGNGCSRARLALDVLKETAAVAAASTEGHGAKENEKSDSHYLGVLS